MGIWGSGNFDEDTAAEHLHDVVRPLIEQVEAAVKDPVSMQPGEYESVAMMCNIEIIACLAEGLGKEGRVYAIPGVPKAETVRAWRSAYLESWEASIDGLGASPELKKQRRAVIVGTFGRLLAVAKAAHSR